MLMSCTQHLAELEVGYGLVCYIRQLGGGIECICTFEENDSLAAAFVHGPVNALEEFDGLLEAWVYDLEYVLEEVDWILVVYVRVLMSHSVREMRP